MGRRRKARPTNRRSDFSAIASDSIDFHRVLLRSTAFSAMGMYRSIKAAWKDSVAASLSKPVLPIKLARETVDDRNVRAHQIIERVLILSVREAADRFVTGVLNV